MCRSLDAWLASSNLHRSLPTRYGVAISLITCVGLALRFARLGAVPLNFDEGATWYFAHWHLAMWLGPEARLETNPPLFYALERAVVLTVGDGATAMRLLPAISGALCIPLAALIAALIGGRHAGIAAALLTATSAVSIGASQDARAYAMLTLAGLIAVAAGLRLLALSGDEAASRAATGWWCTYAAACMACLFLHNTAILLVLSANAVLLFAWLGQAGRQATFLRRWLIANAAVGAVYALWLPVVIYQSRHTLAEFWIAVPTFTDLRYAMMNVYAVPDLRAAQPWADLLLLGAGVKGLLAYRRQRAVLGIGLFILLGVPVASWAISQWRPIMNGKTLLWLAPIFLVFVALGCTQRRRLNWPVTLLVLAVQVAGCASHANRRWDEGFPEAAAVLRAQAKAGDALYLDPPSQAALLGLYGWPADRLHIYASAGGDAWFRNAAVTRLPANDIGPIATAPRVWILTRAKPGVHLALAEALASSDDQALDMTFGHGYVRHMPLQNLELSLFVRRRDPQAR